MNTTHHDMTSLGALLGTPLGTIRSDRRLPACPGPQAAPTNEPSGTDPTYSAPQADAHRDAPPASSAAARPFADTPTENTTRRKQNRGALAWHQLEAYRLPARFTLGEAGDAAVAFPTQWPGCGCRIPDTALAWAEKRAVSWGRRYALAMLMDRHYFDHAYQAHGIRREHHDGPPRPPRRLLDNAELHALAVTEGGALAAGFPAKTRGVSFAYLAQAWPREVLSTFVQATKSLHRLAANGYGLLLQGEAGVGKTCALALLAEAEYRADGLRQYQYEQHAWQRSGPARLRYCTLPQLELLATGSGRHADDWQRHFHDLCAVEHLFLDEYGTQTDNDRVSMLLFELIDARLNALRPTHLASNCDLPTVLPHTPRGERLWERLQECPRFTLTGANGRRPGAWRDLLCVEGDSTC